MFIALRDIRFAKGRFALIGTVVALITLLVGFLTGLTAGLANQNISAVMSFKADSIALQTPADGDILSFSNSSITDKQLNQLKAADGVTNVEPVGISRAKFMGQDKNLNAAVIGLEKSYGENVPSETGSIIVSSNAAKEGGIKVNDKLTLSGTTFTVQAISEESWYSHSPVVWMTYPDWVSYSQKIGQSGEATAALISGDKPATDAVPGITVKSKLSSLVALDAFKSEIGSLGMMVGMLFLISALVIGAFFTVWTIQRKHDIAILKALGVSTKALIRDSLAQAFIILVVGVLVGITATIGLGALAGTALPFVLSPLTMGIPVVAMIVTGLAGAAFALRSVTKADPLTALGAGS